MFVYKAFGCHTAVFIKECLPTVGVNMFSLIIGTEKERYTQKSLKMHLIVG